jgi:hypothetical protein
LTCSGIVVALCQSVDSPPLFPLPTPPPKELTPILPTATPFDALLLFSYTPSSASRQFYVMRVHIISGRKNYLLVAILSLLTAGGFAAELVFAVFRFTHSKTYALIRAE